jgi:hypothetical protein
VSRLGLGLEKAEAQAGPSGFLQGELLHEGSNFVPTTRTNSRTKIVDIGFEFDLNARTVN